MIHYKEQLKDYVLLMLGAPVIAVDLSAEELIFCTEKPVELCQQAGLPGIINTSILTRMVQEGAVALGRYIVAKKKFSRHILKGTVNAPATANFIFTPGEDGFADMTQADSDWNEFVNEVSYFRRALRKPNNERDTEPTTQTD